jgi:ABC-type multidrug transport system permease subunit
MVEHEVVGVSVTETEIIERVRTVYKRDWRIFKAIAGYAAFGLGAAILIWILLR